MARLDYILRLMASERADVLHMAPGRPPELYFGEERHTLDIPAFSARQMQEFVRELTTPEDLADLHASGRTELLYDYEDTLYSCEILSGADGLEAYFRQYDGEVAAEHAPPPVADLEVHLPGLDDLGLPPLGDSRPEPERALPDELLALRQQVLADLQDEGKLQIPLLDHEDSTSFSTLSAPSGPQWPSATSGPGGLRPTASIEYTRSEMTAPPLTAGSHLSRDEFHRLLRWMVEQDATDMHITPRFPPTLRADGVFQPSQGRAFSGREIQQVVTSILTDDERLHLEKEHSVDLSYSVEGLGRFRINIFRQMHGYSAAVRYVRGTLGRFDQLNLPPSLIDLAKLKMGLVLFTGPTGSGKSTTMAAIMEQMNANRQVHILTLEAPVEYVFESKKSLIQQREVGRHTTSFTQGLKDALRENPDVIMVGELRDLETVKMALSASETGHLILATMHANSTGNAVSRLIDVFPDSEKNGARAMISDVIRAVVNLRLVRHASGKGLVPAVEMMRMSPAMGRVIRDGKMHQVKQVLSTAMGEGMWPFERNLADLVAEGMVDHEQALPLVEERSLFEQFLAAARAARAPAPSPDEGKGWRRRKPG